MVQIPRAITNPWDNVHLYRAGVRRVRLFCKTNDIPEPGIHVVEKTDWYFNTCAFYRLTVPCSMKDDGYGDGINICLEHCGRSAHEAKSRNWSWPGSDTDRTPFGVLCHELGHHCDLLRGQRKGAYFSDYSNSLYQESLEQPISGYHDNYAEWFAEMFRVFVTSHDLLKRLRPKTYQLLRRDWKPVSANNWQQELGEKVPLRILNNLLKKVPPQYN